MTAVQIRNWTKLARSFYLLLVLAFTAGRAFAQQDGAGTISGTVRGLAGATLSGARVTLVSENQGLPVLVFTTRADGWFKFAEVMPGKYTVTAELAGFQKASREHIDLTSHQAVAVDLTLARDEPSGTRPGSDSGQAKSILDQAGYYDEPRMKPGEFTGSVDPGGYSTPGHAEKGGNLLRGAVNLKDSSTAGPARGVRSPSPAEDAALAEIELKLKKALQANPRSFEANHSLGEFYIHVGRLTAAIPYLEKAYQINPAHYVNGYDLALAYLETQNYSAARKQVHSMLERQDTAELHDLLGEIYEKSGDYLEAVHEYERAAHQDPSEKNIFDWGIELLVHETLAPAIEVFKRGVELYPRSAKMLIGWGIALYSRGRYDEAVKAFSQATDLDPSDPRPYLFLAQTSGISTAQAPGVTERLRRFAELRPNNPQALYYYALSLWRGERGETRPEDLEVVEKLLRRAAVLDPRFADAHLQLGILCAGRKEYAQAIREYEQTINLNPDLPDAHYRLSQAYVRTGERARAQQEFEIYEQLHKQQLAEGERRRTEIRQFVFALQERTK